MFEDFIQAGEEWKYAMYLIVRKIYETEKVPETFLITVLSAIFKKGDPRSPSNYRYIHGRRPESRLLELAIYQKLSKTFDTKTGEDQLGGMPGSSTSEHLALLIAVIQKKVDEGEGGIVMFQDIIKCFDNIYYSDMGWTMMKEGADLKALKMQTIL